VASRSQRKVRQRVEIRDGRLGVTARIDLADDDPTRDTVTESVEKFLAQSVARQRMASDAEAYNRKEGMIDVLMVDGEGQWDPTVRSKREAKKRPCLTINRFLPMIAHVANEQRSAELSIKIDPTGNGSDKETAEIKQGLIKHIEYDSTADTVYDEAYDRMLEKGWSWFRIVTQYESEKSFDQKMVIQGFDNDFNVYVDPTAVEPTRKDIKWGHIVEDMPVGEYMSEYPKSKLAAASLTGMMSIGDDAPDWVTNGTIRVAEYYYVDEEEAELFQLADGSGKFEDELTADDQLLMDENDKAITRMSSRKKIMWCKHNAMEILDGNDDKTAGRLIGGKWIPLIMVQGRRKNIRGQVRLSGLVRANRDAQRMYNYWVTAFTEMIALAPKSPFVAEAQQVAKYKAIWDSANEEAWPYLPYDAVEKGGQLVGAPQRNSVDPPVQAMIMAIRQADNDLKLGFNIFDASLGQRGPQESGKAIDARKMESESGNFNWLDNMRRAVQHCGQVALDMMPYYYDAARTISVTRADKKQDQVLINAMFKDKKDGKKKKYDMTVGDYACVVSVGPKDGTKRQQAVSSMMDLVKADPAIFKLIGDIIVEHMDWPDSAVIVKRLRQSLPPGMLESTDDQTDEQVAKQALQAKFQALSAQHEQLVGALEKANETIKTKAQEIASKERIVALQEQVKLAGLMQKGDIEVFRAEVARIQQELDLFQMPGPIEGGGESAQPEPTSGTATETESPAQT